MVEQFDVNYISTLNTILQSSRIFNCFFYYHAIAKQRINYL